MPLALSLLPLVAIAPLTAAVADDTAAILAAEREICAAYEREDADWIERHLDPAFTLTSSKGVVTTRAQEAAELRGGTVKYAVFRNRDSRVRLYGDAAVVTGVTVVEGSAGDEAFAAEFQFTDTYVKRGGEWIIVASHASRLAAATQP